MHTDEPTNHLDLGAVVWLEAYLSTYNHILILTSHSQDFMDSICTHILDLTPNKKLVYYTGNYTTYVRTKAENETNQMKAFAKQQDEIAHIKKFIASAGTYANLVKQAKSKQKIIGQDGGGRPYREDRGPRACCISISRTSANCPRRSSRSTRSRSRTRARREDYLYKKLSFGIECVLCHTHLSVCCHLNVSMFQHGLPHRQFSARTARASRRSCISSWACTSHARAPSRSTRNSSSRSTHSTLPTSSPMTRRPLEYLESKYAIKYPEKDSQAWRQQLGRFGLSGTHQVAPISQLSDGLRNR